jgi:hypothetical protein
MNYETVEQKKDPPIQDYAMLEQWAKENSINWSSKELVFAPGILGKIRGQLRPLRFFDYDIKEFSIGYSRFVVPIQWRGEVLESWRRVSDSSLVWEECLEDIWRIGALSLVAEGRNVAMYRTSRMKEHLKDSEFIEFLQCVERYTSIWMCEDPCVCSSVLLEDENEISEMIDLQTLNGYYSIGGLLFNSFDLLRLAIASTFNNEGANIRKVGIFIPLDGKLFSFNLPDNIEQIAETILKIALSKIV